MADFNFERLTKRAIAAFTLERNALLSDDAAALNKAEEAKAGLLAELEAIESRIDALPPSSLGARDREGLDGLLSIIARRTTENEQLAKANAR